MLILKMNGKIGKILDIYSKIKMNLIIFIGLDALKEKELL